MQGDFREDDIAQPEEGKLLNYNSTCIDISHISAQV